MFHSDKPNIHVFMTLIRRMKVVHLHIIEKRFAYIFDVNKLYFLFSVENQPEKYLLTEFACRPFKAKFSHKEYSFGKDTNTTFYVYVYGFRTPFWLQISFSQFPQIDLVHFFVTFFR